MKNFVEDCVGNFVAILLLLLEVGGIVTTVVAVGGLFLAIFLLPLVAVNNTLLSREVPGAVVFVADLLTVVLSLAVALTTAQRLLDAIRRWRVVDKLERLFKLTLDRAR
jgi:hypothetical protein